MPGRKERAKKAGKEVFHEYYAALCRRFLSMQRRGIRLQRAPDPVYVVVTQGDEKVTLLERAILDTKGRSINLHIHFCEAQVCPDPDAHREHWYYKSRLAHPDYGRYRWAYYCAECEHLKEQ